MASLRFLNPDTMSKPPGYTHVVEAVGPGRIVYIAGQLGTDMGGKVVGQGGDFHAQAVQTFENLKAALAAVGATFKDVVKINNYLVDMAHLPVFREVRDMYLNMAAPPASTTIQISGLARPGALLETEAVAILPPAVAAVAERRRPARTARRAKATAKKNAKKKSARPAKRSRK